MLRLEYPNSFLLTGRSFNFNVTLACEKGLEVVFENLLRRAASSHVGGYELEIRIWQLDRRAPGSDLPLDFVG